MAKIEERIVSMKFDNKQFKMAASETISKLDQLKSSLKFDKVGKNLGGIDKELKAISNSANSVDLSNMSRQLDTIQKQWSTMGTVSRSAIDAMTKGALGLATKGFQSAWNKVITGGMNRARNLEQANFMLGGIIDEAAGGAEQIKAIMADANYAVTDTAFGLDSAAKAAAQFAANGMRAGKGMQTSLRAISGVASMTSSSYDEIANIFTTVAGQGKLMSYQLNQLAFRGLNAASTLSKHFGVTEADLRDMVSKGKVSFDDFAEAMDAAFGEQATKSNETFQGALSNLNAAFGRIGAKTATPYLENMRDLFNALRPAVNALNVALDPFIDILNQGMTQSVSTAIKYVNIFTNALETFNKTGTSTSAGWTFVFTLFQDLASVFGLVRNVAVDMIKVMGGAAPTFIAMSSTLGATGTKIQHIFRKLLSVVMLVPEFIGAIVKEVFGLGDGFGSIGGSILDIIDNLASFLYLTAEFIRASKVIQGIAKVIGFVARILVGGFKIAFNAVSAFAGILMKLTKFFSPVIDAVEFLSDGFVRMYKAIKKFKLPAMKVRPLEKLRDTVKSIVEWFKTLGGAIGEISFGVFDSLTQGISNLFKMGSFDFDSVRKFATDSRSILTNSFSGINVGGIKKSFGRVGDFASNAFNSIKSFDYAGLAGSVKKGLSTAFSWTGQKLVDFSEWISDSVSKIDWSTVGKTISDGILKAVLGVAAIAGTVGKFFYDFFKGIFESIDWSALLDSFKDGIENIKGAWSELQDAFSGKEVQTDFLNQALGQVNADATLTVATDIGKQTRTIGDKLKGFWDTLFGRKVDISEEYPAVKDVEKLGTGIRTASAALSNPFGTAKSNIKGLFKDLGDTIRTSVEGFLGGVSVTDLMNSIGLMSGGLGIFKMGEASKGFAAAAKDFAELPKSLAGVFTGIKDSITAIGDAKKIEAKGNNILKLAAALAIFAGAAYLLSRVPWDQMKVGLGATMGLLAALVGAMVAMDKLIPEESADKLKEIGKSMMLIGLAVGILAGSIWLLSKMDTEDVLSGLIAIVGTIAALAAGVALAGLAGSFSGLGMAFLGLALGVGILAGSLLIFKMVNYEDIKKGLITLAGALLAISVAARIANGKKLAGAGVAMLGLGIGLLSLAFGLKAIADLDSDQIIKGLAVLGAVAIAMGGMARLGGGKMVASIGTLLGMSVAMLALAYAAQQLAGVDFWAAVKGMVAIAIGMAGLGFALKAFPPTLPALAGSLMGIAGAIGILVAAVWVIGNMDTDTVIQGMLTLGAALGGFVLAMKFITPASLANVGAVALGMLTLAGAMLLFAFAMKAFDDVNWDSMGKAAAVLVVVIGLFAAMSFFGTAMAPGISALGIALAILGGGLAAIAGAAWIFADAVSKIVNSLVELSNSGGKIKDALKEAGEGITLFAEESQEGLQTLFDAFSNAGAVDVGKIAVLFKTLSEIPPDIKDRLAGLVDGLSQVEDIIPVMQSLNNFGKQVGFGDNRSLSGFFKALGSIDTEFVDKVPDLVQGLKDLNTVTTEMGNISDVGAGINNGFLGIGGDNSALKGFFEAIGSIEPSDGEAISNIIQGIKDLATVTTEMGNISDVGAGIGKGFFGLGGDNSALKGFFKTFQEITPETGANISTFVDGITKLKGVNSDLQNLSNLGANAALGSNGSLSRFFGSFEKITPETGANITTFVDGITKLKGVNSDLQNLSNLGANAALGSNGSLARFFGAFEKITPETGANISTFVDGITKLKKVSSDLSDLSNFGGSIGNGIAGFGGDNSKLEGFFNTFKQIGPETGSNLSAFADGVAELRSSIPTLKNAIIDLTQLDMSTFTSRMSDIGNAMNSGVVEGIKNSATAISDAVASMVSAVTEKSGEFETAGGKLAAAIGTGVSSKKGDVRSKVVDVVNSAASGVAATAKAAFTSVGQAITEGMAAGITSDTVIAKARQVARDAKAAAEAELDINSPSRVFRKIGNQVVQGLAIGLSQNKVSNDAARSMARSVTTSTNKEFDIHSPSRVFRDIGMNLNAGLAGGIKDYAFMPIQALDSLFKEMGGTIEKGMSNIDKALYIASSVNPMTGYLDGVSREARKTRKDALAQRAKDAKEENKRLEKQLYDAEKAYADYEDSLQDSQESIADAHKQISELKDDKKEESKNDNKEKKSAEDTAKQNAEDKKKLTKAQRDLAKQQRDLDAKRRERADRLEAIEKAKQERVWYDANIQGYLAGQAFAEGTESGLRDADEVLKTENELFVDLLSEKVKKSKENIENVRDAIGGLKEIGSIFKNTTTALRDFERAFKRLNASTTDRAAQRNMGIMLDSVLAIGDELIKVVELYDRLEPFLVDGLNMLDKMLPSVLPMITQIAPALGAQLSQGLLVALPQIVGAAGGIIAAIAGIGIFLYDMGKDQKILGFLKKMVNNVIKFISQLPQKIFGILTTMIKGLGNFLKELPKWIPEIINGLINGILFAIQSLPEVIGGLLEAIIEVLITLFTSPQWIVEMIVAIVGALLEAIPKITKAILTVFFKLGTDIIGAIVKGIVGSVKGAISAIGNALQMIVDSIAYAINPFKWGKTPPPWKKGGGSSIGGVGGTVKIETVDPNIFRTGSTSSQVDTSKSVRTANDVLEAQMSARNASSSSSSTTINYTQNNTSPQPLNAIQIYRNTNKQLSMIG